MTDEAAPGENAVDVEGRILRRYDSLSGQQRRLADVVLELSGDLAGWTASELARQAGVSKATAARLFRALGYADYEELRREVRTQAPWGSPLRGLGQADDGNGRDRAQHHFARDMENLRRTEAVLDRGSLDQAARWLALAEANWIVGFRNSFALAQYACSVLHAVRRDVRLVPSVSSEIAEDLAAVGSDDAALVVGFRRRPELLVDVLQVVREAGARVILLTDLSAETTPRLADLTIRCHNRGPGPFDSYVAAMSVLNLLISEVSSQLGTGASQYLTRVENVHERLGDLRGPQYSDADAGDS